jgi:UDP-N-acetylmuramate--alanine ligase
MSALAIILAERGHTVSGSEIRESDVLDTLRSVGVTVQMGQRAENVHGVEIVAYSTAIPDDNIELETARHRGITLLHRGDVLGSAVLADSVIGVAGTHGKTTTSALLLTMLRESGLDPSFVIGAEVRDLGRGAGHGRDRITVVELDESDGTAEVVPVESLIVTNIDIDHLDYFTNEKNIDAAFFDIAQRALRSVVICIDDPGCARLFERFQQEVQRGNRSLPTVVTYGLAEDADVRLSSFHETSSGSQSVVSIDGRTHEVVLPLRGIHNGLNCTAAVAMAHSYGVEPSLAVSAVSRFGGVERRFDEHGVVNGALLIDDYAHLPAEIDAVVRAAANHPQRTGKVIAVFQPNRFHRIAQMADEYADCFQAADVIVITDIYASGTTPIDGVTGKLVVDAITSAHPQADVQWAPQRSDVVAAVLRQLSSGDVCISMGCGDIGRLPSEIAAQVHQ